MKTKQRVFSRSVITSVFICFLLFVGCGKEQLTDEVLSDQKEQQSPTPTQTPTQTPTKQQLKPFTGDETQAKLLFQQQTTNQLTEEKYNDLEKRLESTNLLFFGLSLANIILLLAIILYLIFRKPLSQPGFTTIPDGLCRRCGAELDKNENVCPNCKTRS